MIGGKAEHFGIVLAMLVLFGVSIDAARAQPAFSPYIVVDQFGYTPQMRKIAVIRDPANGFDSGRHFRPGPVYQILAAGSGKVVFEGAPVAWRDGQVDAASGDRAWQFDFTAVREPGDYVVRDRDNGETSARFAVSPDPYRQVLIQAVRFFYYQRAGFAKTPPYTTPAWSSRADHLGPGQDSEARFILKKDPSTARDLHGGWWDAGDFNRYTNWHGLYLIGLMHAYLDNPSVFTDDFNIPESGNGIPDLIDEVKFGMDWLIRMQQPDGSMLSVLGSASASPPDATEQPSYYGGPTTSAAYTSAAAFAFGAKVLARFPAFKAYAADLAVRAERAWQWAEGNPNVQFFNSGIVAAGEQELSSEELPLRVATAAVYLYDLTGERRYDARLAELVPISPLIRTDMVFSHQSHWLQPLLYYASLPNADPALARDIREHFVRGFRDGVYTPEKDDKSPYRAFLPEYYWGSNMQTARQGFFFLASTAHGIDTVPQDAQSYAADYLHYLHGVNPLAKVYLSNMDAFGAANSVDEFFHSWYAKDTPWQNAKTSQFGPPPGYLVGGPNASYNWANGCPRVNPKCGNEPLSPPFGQPPQKSYRDFSDSWPLNSWEITEPSCGYQIDYIRLLVHYVKPGNGALHANS